MKKILTVITFLFIVMQAGACPFCGCGVGTFYMGLLPDFKAKFIGVRYQFMKYHTQLKDSPDEFSNDYYKTIQLWSGITIGKKWQLLTFVPYQLSLQHTDEGTVKQNGLGDVSLLANYSILHSQKINIAKKFLQQHDIWVGGGVKLPTGKYHLDLNNPEVELGDVNAQMGTGSVDFLLNAIYNVTLNNFGLNTSVNYKINTTNSDHYNFGNRVTANSLAYYRLRAKKLSIMPNAGLLYEHAAINHHNSKQVIETGGYVTLAVTGIEVNYKTITLGSNLQIPFTQNFAHGQTEAKLRGMLHLSVTL